MRIGTGFDIHTHDNDNKLSIGTVNIEGAGFVAHSDGDIVVHALIDALLAAAGLGDIGEVFPSEDQKWEDASGKSLLLITKEIISDAGLIIENIDIIIISNRIKISPIKEKIVTSISEILDLDKASVSIKGKTTNGSNLLFDDEASAAIATVLGRVS